MQFQRFKQAVAKQFAAMSQQALFETDVTRDDLWAKYLNSFPTGSNPIYRERTEHDCSCCRQFIKTIGNVVAVDSNGQLVSIWDVKLPDEPSYQAVANALSTFVKSAKIRDVFKHYEKHVGTDRNFEQLTTGQRTWDHFFVNLPAEHVMRRYDIGTYLGQRRAAYDVTVRGLTEITDEAVQTVRELIEQGSLYRGEEHLTTVKEFTKLKKEFNKASSDTRDNFVWGLVASGNFYGMARNTVIGTLLVDLSEGKDLEYAVKSFEQKVAPANYKRPTALITQGMIDKAKETITQLGLLSALDRRHARLSDLDVNDILFADREARKAITGDGAFDLLSPNKTGHKSMSKIEEVPIDQFIANVLPNINTLEVMVENSHSGNLMSIITADDPTAGRLFKWGNSFSWTYNGEVTDSIKERVKAAGGNVTGELCCRLAWDYTDDLDFHMHEPNFHLYYGYRRAKTPNGGMLDVDANGADGLRDNPVENIFYERLNTMRPGNYQLSVNNFNRRSNGSGFTVEIDLLGEVTTLEFDQVVRSSGRIPVAEITKHADGTVTINPKLPSTTRSKELWGIKTNVFQRVSTFMLSPNHWGGEAVGNKHYFFLLDGCANPDATRGFYNEFLDGRLDQHRKVFEMLGSKMRVAPTNEQLSGVGFSSTQRNSIVARVSGSFTRTIKIVF